MRWGSLAVLAVLVLLATGFGAILPSNSFGTGSPPNSRPGTHATFAAASPVRLTPAHSAPALGPDLRFASGVTIIAPNGTVTGPPVPWTVSGESYTLTADFSGSILDERNGSVLNGGGRTVSPVPGTPWALEVASASGVRIESFGVANATGGVLVLDAQNVTVLANRVAATSWAVGVAASSDVTVANTTSDRSAGVSIQTSVTVTLTGNRMSNASVAFAEVLDSGGVQVVHNVGDGSVVGIQMVRSSSVRLWGNSLPSTGTGISLDQVTNAVVSWNNLSGATAAIGIAASSGISGSGNTGSAGGTALDVNGTVDVVLVNESFSGFSIGVRAYGSSNVTVNDSVFLGESRAVVLSQSSLLRLQQDNFSGFRQQGIDIENSSQVLVDHDSASTTVGSAGSTVYAAYVVGLQLVHLSASGNPAGSTISYSAEGRLIEVDLSHTSGTQPSLSLFADSSFLVSLGRFSNASGVGVSFSQVTNATVESTDVSHAGSVGSQVVGSAHLLFSYVRFDHAGSLGLNLVDSTDVQVLNCMAGSELGSGGRGIVGTGLTASTLGSDNVTGAGRALDLENSSALLVLNVTAADSVVGVYLAGDANVTVAGNWIVSDQWSVAVQNCSQSGIFHNNFLGDGGWQIGPGDLGVAWDAGYPEGGNYWSNHTSPDVLSGPNQTTQGADGIVDRPVVLSAGSVDHYPLAGLWYGFVITFTESGLATGTNWDVRVNGQLFTSNLPTIVVPQLNGPSSTYLYRILAVTGYSLVTLPSSGPWPEQRENVSITATFAPSLYPLTFEVFGLAPGTLWTVVVGSGSASSVKSTIVMMEPNGSYSYLVGKVSGYLLDSGSGLVTVQGVPVQVVVVYSALPGTAAASSLVPYEEYGVAAVVVLALAVVVPMIVSRRRRGRRVPTAWAPPSGAGMSRAGPDESGPPNE